MAQMVNLGISLQSKVEALNRKRVRYCFQAFLVSGLLSLLFTYLSCKRYNEIGVLVLAADILNLVFCVSGIKRTMKEIGIISSGNEGEKKANILLSVLPDDYYVFSNVRVIQNGEDAEIDNVVVSPYAMYVVEIKNIKGIITGDIRDKKLIRTKHDKWNNEFKEEISNPVNQVERQARILRSYIREVEDIDFPLLKCVFFANKEATVLVDGVNEHPEFGQTGIYSNKDALIEFLRLSETDEEYRLFIFDQQENCQALYDLVRFADVPKVTYNE